MPYAEVSRRLDAVILLLEKPIPAPMRKMLLAYKRWLEQYI